LIYSYEEKIWVVGPAGLNVVVDYQSYALLCRKHHSVQTEFYQYNVAEMHRSVGGEVVQ